MRESASDSSVQAVVLEIEAPKFNFAQVQELRGVIREIQDADKTVIAWIGGSVGNAEYLLATAADEIHLHPAGNLMVLGIAAQVRYLKGTLDLVGAEAQFARRSEYKSGPERFTRTDSSEPATEQISALLDDLHGELVAGIAASRDLDPAAVQALIDRGPLTGAEALEAGLIDGICYREEVGKVLIEDEDEDEDDLETDRDYHLATDLSGWGSASRIAIVYVQGPITSGESSSGGLLGGASTGSKTVVEALEAIAEDSSVKAVVMRVDSPGGSAYASDEIWKAVRKVQEEDKPVIVSMGGMAASGGYYVAAGADVIYAEPTTITGSIGVYGGKLSFDNLYGKLGVSHEIHTRGRMGPCTWTPTAWTPWNSRPWTRWSEMSTASSRKRSRKGGTCRTRRWRKWHAAGSGRARLLWRSVSWTSWGGFRRRLPGPERKRGFPSGLTSRWSPSREGAGCWGPWPRR
jgi:protease-4